MYLISEPITKPMSPFNPFSPRVSGMYDAQIHKNDMHMDWFVRRCLLQLILEGIDTVDILSDVAVRVIEHIEGVLTKDNVADPVLAAEYLTAYRTFQHFLNIARGDSNSFDETVVEEILEFTDLGEHMPVLARELASVCLQAPSLAIFHNG